VKLSPLLSQFLFSNKLLPLSGIGRFKLDDSGILTFEQDASVKEDISLVNYIAEQTGKMKSLVSADLDSYLELARQFLNIGKPYLFEGIGTLSKNKFGIYDFTQINSAAEKKENAGQGRDITSTTENSFTDYEEMFSPKRPKALTVKKVTTWVIAFAGLSLAVFGGYLVYTKTKNKKTSPANTTGEVIKKELRSDAANVKDSMGQRIRNIVAPSAPADSAGNIYRFVIEKAARLRAFSRYNRLRYDSIKVQMDTKDSLLFTLYFPLRSLPADTTRKKDSLQRLYGTRQKTRIEFN